MRVANHRELRVRDELQRLEIEHFLPVKWGQRTYGGHLRRVQVPLLNMIFVHSSQEEITRQKMYNAELSYMRYKMNVSHEEATLSEVIIVPDREMNNFIRATLHGDDVKLVNSGASNVDFTIEAREMEMSNSGASKSDVRFKGRRLQTSNTGAGKVFLDVDCEELSASNSGAAKFTIEGTADKTDIQASGVSKINTSKLNKY